jgi:phage gp36-like protein
VTQYATIADLFRYGLREEAAADIPRSILNAELAAASVVVDGYLVGRYGVGSMPLTAWSAEVTRWVCWMTAYALMSGARGYASEGDGDGNLRTRHDDAHHMLGRTQRQDYSPVGLTPQNAQGSTGIQPLVISSSVVNLATGCRGSSRGW